MHSGTFAQTVEPEIPVLYRVASRLVRRREDAEDLVGQTLLLAAQAWPKFNGTYLRSWLLRILRNTHLNSLRRLPESSLTELEASGQDVHQDVTTSLTYGSILSFLDALPEEFRMAVVLCDIEEMSYREAAHAMKVPVGTLQSRLFRGRKMLKDHLELGHAHTTPLGTTTHAATH